MLPGVGKKSTGSKDLLQNIQDPEYFFRNILKVKQLWDGQIKVLEALNNHKKVAVASGHSLGKDFLGGGLPLWFLCAFDPSKVIMTAPTDRQIESIMWAELTRHYENAGGQSVMGGNLLSRKFIIDEKNCFCIAFTTKETKNQTGKFQGFHSPNILVIVSEAQAVDDVVFEQIEAVLTSKNSRLLLLGNPLRGAGYFARALRGSEFKTIHLSCLETPNYLHREEIIPGVASYDWVENMRQKYGENSPMWQARVLGQLPDTGIDNVIPYELARGAVNKPIPYIRKPRRIISVDPATFGDDECVIYAMEERKIIEQIILSKKPTTEICGRVIILQRKFRAQAVGIDSIGEGRGLSDFIKEAGIHVIEVKGSHEAKDKELYQNLRAQIWFHGKEMLENGKYCSIPDDEVLIEELAECKYFVNSRGRYQIEGKDDLKSRLGRSPDRADAFLIGLWILTKIAKDENNLRGGPNLSHDGRMIWSDGYSSTPPAEESPRYPTRGY
jgi:phage terminase large subunit